MSKNPFGTIEEKDLESQDFGPTITEPVIANAYLTDVNADPIPGKDDTSWDTLNFVFAVGIKNESGEVKPVEFRHAEFYPDDDKDDFASKGKNMLKRIAYILKYYIGKEEALKLVDNWETWDELKKNIVKKMSSVNYKKKKISVKLVGNAYNLRVGFPKYLGFIADENSENPLSFNKGELEENARYMYKLKTGGSRSPSASVSSGSSDEEELLEF